MSAFTSPLPDVALPETSLTDHVFRDVDARADKAAFVDGPTGRTLTFGQVRDLSRRFAGALRRSGFAPGDVLGLLAPNIPEYAVVFFGTVMAGGTVTTINPTYTPEEIHGQLVDAGATRLVTVGPFVETARTAADGTKVSGLVVIGGVEKGATDLAEHLAGDAIEDAVAVDVDTDVAVLPYSSGTMGRSKGVMLTHRNLTANLAQCAAVLETEPSDVVIAVLPFFHIYGMNLLLNAGLDRGTTTITMPRFDMEEFLRLVQDHRVTVAFLVPPIILGLAKHPAVDTYDLSSLRLITSGAAPLGADTGAQAAQRIGCEVVQGYGMTELSPLTHLSLHGSTKVGSIGPLVPNTTCRVVSPQQGSDLGVGEDGELWIRGPQVMKGYLGNPAATAATITEDGWLRTGDIGHVDADGDFWIVDRLKELIKVSGFQVAPAELEELLITHPEIADAAVIGVPDEDSGEAPRAFVVLVAGSSLTEQDVRDHLARRVATYKQVRDVVFTDQIPKSASGKILRRMLSAGGG
jgi:acyl-CoA synthetase (AMP-forming)/AMP-acid ligase II